MSHRPVVLMILDGYGLNDNPEANAVAMANTPVMDKLMAECPFQKGYASGMAVGLPDGQMGNSEVGHMNMGAGRIVYQELTRITKEIQDGVFFENPELLAAINNCKIRGSDLHLYGLLSDGGVHSHNTHLYALLEMAKRNGLDRVYVDCFLAGRDTPPRSGIDFLAQLEDKMKEIGVGKIAMISGRYYAMDRDNNYDRVKIAYDALTKGEGLTASSSAEAIQGSYDRDESDEFVKPTVITEDGKPVSLIKDGDSVIFFNFRPDRAREITHCFCDNDFTMFDRGPRKKVFYVCFNEIVRRNETFSRTSKCFDVAVTAIDRTEYAIKDSLQGTGTKPTVLYCKYAGRHFYFFPEYPVKYRISAPVERKQIYAYVALGQEIFAPKPGLCAIERKQDIVRRIAISYYKTISRRGNAMPDMTFKPVAESRRPEHVFPAYITAGTVFRKPVAFFAENETNARIKKRIKPHELYRRTKIA